MSALETFLVSRFMVFTLVLARVSPLVITAPIFGSLSLPRQVRVVLAVMLSLLIAPAFLNTSLPPVGNTIEYGRLLVNEALVGLLLGLGLNILFSGVQLTGEVVSQLSGLSLADVFNPGFDEDISIFSQLFYLVTLAVFVAVGGHRIMVQAMLDTFAAAPPGHAALGTNFVDVLMNIVGQSFVLGVRAAAPLMVALLLSNLVLGLISRTLPQINVIVVGFGLNSLLAMSLLFLTIGAAAWTFQDPSLAVLRHLKEALVVSR
ncbi:MAG TPA: flagellar biosynthetic protein FliR [Lacipirellulaceae bacterium]|nr:flagellar biosynthetic protein FliR [Lacipirellulaceae bacterium]